ncbi:MAG: lipoate--protein ligase [Solobacterium sp.]|nr:lipoate--protein ligase [Solobacterium sp.]
MIQTCTIVTTECTDPYHNLALEELLLKSVREEEIILYLWQNSHTIVIGRNQNVWQECNVELFQKDNGRIARRLSGGGAVYHDLGNQNFTFLAGKKNYSLDRQFAVIQKAVDSFGLNTVRSGRNDLTVDGRKFSGNAFYSDGHVKYHHGTLLVNADMGRLGKYLTPSKEKLAAKGVASVEARVVNLAALNPAITPGTICHALTRAMAEEYGVPVITAKEQDYDQQAFEQLRQKYASDAWLYDRLKDFDVKTEIRTGKGLYTLYLEVTEGIIKDVRIHTDRMNPEGIQEAEQSLLGLRYVRAAVEQALLANEAAYPGESD